MTRKIVLCLLSLFLAATLFAGETTKINLFASIGWGSCWISSSNTLYCSESNTANLIPVSIDVVDGKGTWEYKFKSQEGVEFTAVIKVNKEWGLWWYELTGYIYWSAPHMAPQVTMKHKSFETFTQVRVTGERYGDYRSSYWPILNLDPIH